MIFQCSGVTTFSNAGTSMVAKAHLVTLVASAVCILYAKHGVGFF